MERIDYVILYADDLDREVAFYRDVLGLPFRFRDRGYAEFGLRDLRLGLFDRSGLGELLGPEGAARRPGGEILFLVPDVDAWAERLRA
ncbi:MAG TPA: VOC family protein, partial [Actinomycetota bacterium]|nr:VOC family protein [Actinomycetota bacterium]